ncbi:hypothetical protein PAPYR_12671 [Paratrimastix pyriformis]|uniref:Uncharacterized protein n=1 Tax=Paratrimastix pyriformis TaxID=342808 RepID=A0ABQ8U5X8_9EUKA|nr:hypothetical protein PAPYR_12671 [Paratrimastix pyriformis]
MLPDDPTGDYILVVMADVSFTSWSDMAVAERKAHVARLGAAVEELLHAQGLAHGDLRRCNVGLARAPPTADPWLCVLDYDWAGPAGAVRYPPNINHEIRWPKGALGEAPIKVEHDLHWLELLRQSCDRAGLHDKDPMFILSRNIERLNKFNPYFIFLQIVPTPRGGFAGEGPRPHQSTSPTTVSEVHEKPHAGPTGLARAAPVNLWHDLWLQPRGVGPPKCRVHSALGPRRDWWGYLGSIRIFNFFHCALGSPPPGPISKIAPKRF